MMLFAAMLFIVPGVIGLFFPAVGWYMRYGWMVKGESQPSDAFLWVSRIGGGIAILIGLYILLSGDLLGLIQQ